jgi:hypothetical protein
MIWTAVRGFVIVMGLVAIGCQGALEDEVELGVDEQALGDCFGVANFCGKTMPSATPWNGGALPGTTATTVVIVHRGTQSTWYAMAADWSGNGKVHWVRSIPASIVDNFLNAVVLAGRSYAGLRPPRCPPTDPDCNPLGTDAPFYLEAALRISAAQSGANAAIAACQQ